MRLDAKQCSGVCSINARRWRSLGNLTDSAQNVICTGTGLKDYSIPRLHKAFDCMLKIAATQCYLDRESPEFQGPEFMTYYEQVRFLHFFLTTHTFVCLENCFSQPNIPEHQLIDCFEQVLFSTFFREKDHGGKHEQRTSYGSPGKVSCISIVTDRTLSPFRASYSATEQETLREMTFNFCFRLLEAIGIFRQDKTDDRRESIV